MSNQHQEPWREQAGMNRRDFLQTTAVATAATVAATGIGTTSATAAASKYAPPAKSALPPSAMQLDLKRTALVVTDPQIDFLSPKGGAWGSWARTCKRCTRSKTSVGCSNSPKGRTFPLSFRLTITIPLTRAGNLRGHLKSSCTTLVCSIALVPIL